MPGKLIAVIVLMGIGVGLNLATQSWLSAILGGLLIAFLVRGSHTARAIAIWLTVLGLGGLAFMLIQAASAVGLSNLPVLVWIAVGFGVVNAAYNLWALTREDVVAWMDERGGGGGGGRGDKGNVPKYV